MSERRVLVLGGTGMLGSTAYTVLSRRFETFRTVRGEWDRFYTVPFVDALDPGSVSGAIDEVQPNVVLNCIGIVRQSAVIGDVEQTIAVNALFPHRLADICTKHGARLIHVSTDCVFSGRKGNYTEQDEPDPMDLYGRTKLLGEVDYLPDCLTVRTSFIGRQSGLLRWLLDSEGETVSGYANAVWSGLAASTLCRILGDVIADHPGLSGLYHLAGAPIRKCDLLVRLRDALGLNVEIEPCPVPRYDRSLDASLFWNATGLVPPTWGKMIVELAAECA